MIESGDRHDRPNRLTEGIGFASCPRLRQVHRDFAPAAGEQFVYAQFDALNGATGFHARVDDGFTALERNLHCQCLRALAHQPDGALQDGDAFMRGEPRLSVFVQRARLVEPTIDLRPVDQLNAANAFLVVGIEDLPRHWGHSIALSSSIRTLRFSE